MNEITQVAGKISFDFEGARTKLEAYCNEYLGVVFTEETKAEAKKTVATFVKSRRNGSQ